ncbi:Bystin [Araneus ventricosus]|uniref:Bystin n=1 Tax=Araneus ventricosus TaxID=182803 RepID=A0A4Y2AF98_ARAVE|nr:Bystin [Araneus ventricosus]
MYAWAITVDDKLTQKILTEARKQLEDVEEEVGLGSICKQLQTSHLFAGLPDEKDGVDFPDDENVPGDESPEEEIDEETKNAIETFMPNDPDKKSALVDLLKEKFTEKRTEINTIYSDAGSLRGEELEKFTVIYKGVGQVLSKYRSGKIPKAFKAIPKFANWEQLLYLTDPDNWTAAAMFQATRLFSSGMKSEMAQRFYNLILLPRLRDDIAQCKKLNDHLYRALKKALFKPRAFFKGMIIPLCESGTCSLREATIFGSILAKCSIPSIHSSVALLYISKMPYSGANCIFMRVLIEKKYALPYLAIDGIVDYFLRFMKDDSALPLLWHQCLLTFVQIYKNDLSQDQQRELMKLLKVQNHPLVSLEIRKELLSANCQNRETTASMTTE